MRIGEVRRQATEVAAAVTDAEYERQPEVFWQAIRASDLPFLPCQLWKRPAALFSANLEAVYLLGRASLPLTVGYGMHQYMLSALACAPVPSDFPLAKGKNAFLERVTRQRALILVSSFGDRIKAEGKPKYEVTVTREGQGFRARGRKMFQSMASQADWTSFAATLEGTGLCLFWSPLRDREGFEFGPTVFGGSMAHTDTRVLDYNDVRLEKENVLSLDDEQTYDLLHYATAWFEGLVGAIYLGAASRALEECRRFARQMMTKWGLPLGDLDGVRADMGRLVIRHQAALELVRSFADLVVQVTPDNFRQGAYRLLESSSALKYESARACEEILDGVRAIVGTRSLAVGSWLHRLSEQLRYCQLHPLMAATIERDFGRLLLKDRPFIGLPRH